MRDRRSHAYATDRPTRLERPRDLPADVVHTREVEWLGELRVRLAAVEAWRGQVDGRLTAKRTGLAT